MQNVIPLTREDMQYLILILLKGHVFPFAVFLPDLAFFSPSFGIQPLDIQPTLLLFISFSLTFMIIHSLQFATNEVRAPSNYLSYRVASSIFSVKGFRKFFIQDVFTQYSFHIQSVCLKLVCIPLCLNILIRQH